MVPAGRTNTAIQQQIPQLVGVVSSFPGSGGCPRLEQGPESVTTGVLLDETAMNVTQELGDNDLYNYDVLVKLLSDRFDPALRVSAFRSRFHGLSRRHHEDADTFADALAELCRVGYPQSPPEMQQELIAEQFVRGQSDPEISLGGHPDSEGQEASNSNRSLHGFFEPSNTHTPTPPGRTNLRCTSADGVVY